MAGALHARLPRGLEIIQEGGQAAVLDDRGSTPRNAFVITGAARGRIVNRGVVDQGEAPSGDLVAEPVCEGRVSLQHVLPIDPHEKRQQQGEGAAGAEDDRHLPGGERGRALGEPKLLDGSLGNLTRVQEGPPPAPIVVHIQHVGPAHEHPPDADAV